MEETIKNKERKGLFYVLLAGTAWGLSGVFGQYLIAAGIPVFILIACRLFFSGLVLTGLAVKWNRADVVRLLSSKKAMLGIGIFAILGLVLNQYAYLVAIQTSNAGTATVLEYLCPIFVLVYSCLKDRTWPDALDVVAFGLAIFGTFMIATHGQWTSLALTPQGLFWGIFSAFTYALYMIVPLNLIREYGSLAVMGVGMLLASIFVVPLSGAVTFNWQLDWTLFLALAGMVVIGTIVSYTLFLKGTSLIGPVKSSLLASVEPVAAVIFSAIFLSEHFYAMDIVGMGLIIGAVLLISLKDSIRAQLKRS